MKNKKLIEKIKNRRSNANKTFKVLNIDDMFSTPIGNIIYKKINNNQASVIYDLI